MGKKENCDRKESMFRTLMKARTNGERKLLEKVCKEHLLDVDSALEVMSQMVALVRHPSMDLQIETCPAKWRVRLDDTDQVSYQQSGVLTNFSGNTFIRAIKGAVGKNYSLYYGQDFC